MMQPASHLAPRAHANTQERPSHSILGLSSRKQAAVKQPTRMRATIGTFTPLLHCAH